MNEHDDEIDYKTTQPYRLGSLYKCLGEMLMNPATTVDDLTQYCDKLGCTLSILLGKFPDEQE